MPDAAVETAPALETVETAAETAPPDTPAPPDGPLGDSAPWDLDGDGAAGQGAEVSGPDPGPSQPDAAAESASLDGAADATSDPETGDADALQGGSDDAPALDAAPALADTLADSATPTDATAATVLDSADSADGTTTSPEATPADGSLPEATPNVLLQISSSLPLAGQNLVVFALAPGQPPPDPNAGDKPLWQGKITGQWPMTVPVVLQPGAWQVGAEVKGSAQGPPLAMGTVCAQGKQALVQAKETVQSFAINLVMPSNLFSIDDLCAGPKPPGPPAYLKTQSATNPPNTKDGGPHFVQAQVFGDRLWVAGSQDGYVSFDFPGGVASTSPHANWQVHGGQFCNRSIRVGKRLYCSSRAAYVHILDLAASQQPLSLSKVTVATDPTEGLMHREGLVYVATHGKGVVAFAADPPYAAKAVTLPADLTEAWDLALVGTDHVAVANGAAGLVFGSLAGAGGPYALQPLSKLPLPGVAAYLHLDGTTLAVGALGGGAHVVDVANPTQPKLLTTLQFSLNTYAVTLVANHVYAAAGGAIVVGSKQSTDNWIVRSALRSESFVLDVDVHGTGLLSAEFRTIRRTLIDPKAALAGPVLVAPRTLTTAPIAVGATVGVVVELRNLGSAPLTVTQILWQELAMGNGGSLSFPGPWQVPAKGALTIPLSVKKSIKGVLDHQFVVMSDDPSQPEIAIAHRETTWLHVGDKLPKLPVYEDGKGGTTNIAVHFSGKVGVLLVAAHSCPVAFQALAAARRDLGPLVAQGTVAAVAINPWDTPKTAEVAAFDMPFPMLFSGLTTSDGHDWSEVLDVTLGQPLLAGPPMPITYVVGKDGKLALARWGYDSAEVLGVVAIAAAK